MKAYKIVYINQKGERLSLLTTSPEMMVEYIPQEWASPRTGYGPLYCFDSPENAKLFFERVFDRGFKNWEIWECETKTAKLKTIWRRHLGDMPQGTVLADKVKLLRKMEV